MCLSRAFVASRLQQNRRRSTSTATRHNPTVLVQKPESQPRNGFRSLAAANEKLKNKEKNGTRDLQYKNRGEWAELKTEEESAPPCKQTTAARLENPAQCAFKSDDNVLRFAVWFSERGVSTVIPGGRAGWKRGGPR